MKIHDITVPTHDRMLVWPGDPGPTIEFTRTTAEGQLFNLTRLAMTAHTGTHVDAPFHMITDGVRLDGVPLDTWVGVADVIDLSGVDRIDAGDLAAAGVPEDSARLLLKTRNSDLWKRGDLQFHRDFVALTEDAARWLVERGIRLVGVDYLSIDAFDTEAFPVHRILLSAGVVAVENLDLSAVVAGRYMMYCLPLRLVGRDGAPARVILTAP